MHARSFPSTGTVTTRVLELVHGDLVEMPVRTAQGFRYFVGFHATSAGQKQQEAMNHLEKKWKKLNNGAGADDAVAAGKSLSRSEVIEVRIFLPFSENSDTGNTNECMCAIQMAIEAIATVYSQDFEENELEIGIVSTADDEPEESRGKWRTMDEQEIEHHLLAYAEKD